VNSVQALAARTIRGLSSVTTLNRNHLPIVGAHEDRNWDTLSVSTIRPTLPTLTANRQFMLDFIGEKAPCVSLGLVEAEGSQCAMIVLRLNQPLPKKISAAGFAFGHRFIAGGDWEVVHFGFEFYDFGTYHVLINPGDPVVRVLLRTMMEIGDYFIFALDSDRSTAAFRSDIAPDNLIWPELNMARIEGSTTTEALYEEAVSLFGECPDQRRHRPRPWPCRTPVSHAPGTSPPHSESRCALPPVHKQSGLIVVEGRCAEREIDFDASDVLNWPRGIVGLGIWVVLRKGAKVRKTTSLFPEKRRSPPFMQGFISPFRLRISVRSSRWHFSPEKKYRRPQNGPGVLKTLEFRMTGYRHASQGKPGKTCS
jgi:hypothetical protein